MNVLVDGRRRRRIIAGFFGIMNEMATRAIRAKADGMESAAQFRLVFRMTDETAQLVKSVRKLALVAVFARAILFVRSAQFRLVATRVGLLLILLLLLSQLLRSIDHRLAVAPVQFAMAAMQLHHQR